MQCKVQANKIHSRFGVAKAATPFFMTKIIHRRLIDLDEKIDLPAAARARVAAVERMLPVIYFCAGDLAIILADKKLLKYTNRLKSTLQHRLSDHVMNSCVGSFCKLDRSRLEKGALNNYFKIVNNLNSSNLLGMINAACIELTGNSNTLRNGDMYVKSHLGSSAIKFEKTSLNLFLRVLDSCLLDKSSPLIKAIRCMVSILNLHPLHDGNGRIARIVFNYFLRLSGLPKCSYIPIYEFFCFSEGGYEVRLRGAEIYGNWQGFIEYICNILEACYEIHRLKLDR